MNVSASAPSTPLWHSRSTQKQSGDDSSRPTKSAAATSANLKPLTDGQKQQIEKLKQRDADVRRHEAAHLAVAGGSARSGPVYNYQTGPDGKQYAVGGHVDIDTSAVAGNPQATIAKMQQVRSAALAPADPSGQDRSVAAEASNEEQQARAELSAQRAASSDSKTRQPNSAKSSGKYSSSSAEQAGQLIDIAA